MSTGYHWMNFERREQLAVEPFKSDIKLYSTCIIGNEYTEAALTLLTGDWAGDANAYISDDFTKKDLVGAGSPAFLVRAADKFGEFVFEEAEETFACVEGRFTIMDGRVQRTYYDDWPLYTDKPYVGPFDLELAHPRYVINRTKLEYIDRHHTMACYIRRGHLPFEVLRFDPTPLLLCTSGGLDDYWAHGPWLGDYVCAGDECPDESYRDATRDYIYVVGQERPVYATDKQILAVMERRVDDYGDLTKQQIEDIKSCLRTW